MKTTISAKERANGLRRIVKHGHLWPEANEELTEASMILDHHAELLEAVKGILSIVNKHHSTFGQEASARAFINDPETPKAFSLARAAIAKAEGEP